MKKAYFRIFQHSNQCELTFYLKILCPELGTINQEIKAVRKCTDNIKSLLEHIRNKIVKIIRTQNDSQNVENDNELNNDDDDLITYKENNSPTEIPVSITQNGMEVDGDTVCEELIKAEKTAIFCIFDIQYQVLMNAPLILTLMLPSILYTKCSIRPVKFKAIHTDKALCHYTWYTSSDKENWTTVSNKNFYAPTKSDINSYVKLRIIPRNKNSDGPYVDIISETSVIEMGALPICPFDKRQEMTQNKLNDKAFRIVSYNVLANRYTDKDQFPYCLAEALSIDYRKQLILKELLGYNADIICLQEVDSVIYYNYFINKFKKAGYDGTFHKKGNKIPEGLACFYNRARFKYLESKLLVFSNELETNPLFGYISEVVNTNQPIKECLLKQLTSLQVVILKSKDNSRVIIVANTHLYYHSEAGHIRMLQMAIAMEYIKNVYTTQKLKTRCKVSVLVCGDFNSNPLSGVFEFMSKGIIKPNHQEWKQQSDFTMTTSLYHQFQFGSACGTPQYTNYTDTFKGCLDYIFYDKTDTTVTSYVPIPDEKILSENIAIPSKVFPSDHIALVANLKWL